MSTLQDIKSCIGLITMRNATRDDQDERWTNQRSAADQWGARIWMRNVIVWGQGIPGRPATGPAGINCYVSAAAATCVSLSHQQPDLQIQLQELNRDDRDMYLSLCQIQSRCQQDSVMTNHVLGPKTNRVDNACETLSFGEHYLLNSSSILSSCSGVNIVRTLLFFILRPPSGRMSSENEILLWIYDVCWICV